MTKSLENILAEVKPVSVTGKTEVEITGITSDSRKVKPGMLFVAVCGVNVDGHNFISSAIDAGFCPDRTRKAVERWQW